ncbi:activated RNA polymerase II transcriptional coactivator p15 [Phymastichus coffea]|uniref:activated RNA polymerase II transcriptional coactivator p15 n=1 Tax=Phymastichus coffea TaxID=108790 RepID=UPI00273AE63C|nr:activated RNA polymerase II transcriptional coactivator p15 [Phymastichus coffea]XP_058789411.1 activated RNA polymerase II transcriptional coactivator p15 [Phymastichus coffea]
MSKMPISKEVISDSDSSGASEEEVKQKSKPRQQVKKKQESSGSESEEEMKQKTKSKEKGQKSSDSESDDNSMSKKRSKKSKDDNGSNKKAKTQGSMQENDQGEVFWDLGASKRITVRSFKGKLLIDIREYYDDKGTMKPGKKGIALQTTNWNALKSVFDEVDNYVKSQ